MAEMGLIKYGSPKRPARDGEFCCCGEPATVVVLTDDLGPVPFCGTPGDGHRPSDCPPWCAQEDHQFPYGRKHSDIGHSIPLDAFPERSSLLVGLSKEPGKPAYIELVGVDDQLAGCLTAYEADQLAGILRDLAATLRREHRAGARDESRADDRRADVAPADGPHLSQVGDVRSPPLSSPTPKP